MNTYNDNLQTTIRGTLDSLYNNGLDLQSAKVCAELNLYFAQGALITAEDRLEEASNDYDSVQRVQVQGVKNTNGATNVQSTAVLVQGKNATTVTNAATAANNVQVATNAITKLAADIGAAFNIVSAADFGTDIYRMTKNADGFIKKTAYHAEYTSQISMEASRDVAEITASQLLNDANTTQVGVSNLLDTINAEFAKSSSTVETDTTNMADASNKEKLAEGNLLDAEQQNKGINQAYIRSNYDLNYDLLSVAKSSTSFSVSFNPFQCPFDLSDPLNSSIPDPSPQYYIVLVEESKKALFKIEQAESSFSEYKVDSFCDAAPTLQMQPLAPVHANNSFGPGPVIPATTTIDITGKMDSDGNPIVSGTSYVAFLYIELSLDYKKYIANFNDMLSAPSLPFTMTTNLPVIDTTTTGVLKPIETDKKITGFSFTIPDNSDLESISEFRFMLLPAKKPQRVESLIAWEEKADEPDIVTGKLGFYFNMNIAMQVTSANYMVAEADTDANKQDSNLFHYSVTLADDTTDNFGNLIIPGQEYVPAILTVYNGSVDQQSKYINSLSDLKINAVCIVPENDGSEFAVTATSSAATATNSSTTNSGTTDTTGTKSTAKAKGSAKPQEAAKAEDDTKDQGDSE